MERPGPAWPPRGWCGQAGLGGARPAAGKKAGARAGNSAEAQPHKEAGDATGAALSWVGFVKSWPVSRKPSSCPKEREGPNPSLRPPESLLSVLCAQRCQTAPSRTLSTLPLLQPPCLRRWVRGMCAAALGALADSGSLLLMPRGLASHPPTQNAAPSAKAWGGEGQEWSPGLVSPPVWVGTGLEVWTGRDRPLSQIPASCVWDEAVGKVLWGPEVSSCHWRAMGAGERNTSSSSGIGAFLGAGLPWSRRGRGKGIGSCNGLIKAPDVSHYYGKKGLVEETVVQGLIRGCLLLPRITNTSLGGGGLLYFLG